MISQEHILWAESSAPLVAAVFLMRDWSIQGNAISILEESSRIGGSFDPAGNATNGYVMRGGRMIESKYLCTCVHFSSVPTLDGSMNEGTRLLQAHHSSLSSRSDPARSQFRHR
jgi:myosin-crossreactive antigen